MRFIRRLQAQRSPAETAISSGEPLRAQDREAVEKSPFADLDDLRYAYRLLLGREPDPEGFASHAKRIETRTLTPAALADGFIGSAEFAARHGPTEIRLDGYSLFVRPSDRDIGQQILQTGQYEPHVASVVRSLLRPGQTFVDVGANIGFFAALAAHLVGDTGKVVAVEPMDKNIQLLYATVWHNRFRHVEIHPYAASDHEGLVPMLSSGMSSNGQVFSGGASAEQPNLFAQSKRLDDLLARLAAVSLLKIDIEGYELRALRGFEQGLARHRPLLLTEFNPRCMREHAAVEPQDYLAFLFEYGASVEVLHHDGERVACVDAGAVMQEWQRADRRFSSGGTTHIDLFVRPRA